MRGSDPVSHPVTRRKLLSLTGSGFVAGALVVATNGNVTAQVSASTPEITTFQEAPILAEQVASGALPPVSERLPSQPLVVTPVDQVGLYSGAWHTALVGGSDTPWLARTIGMENLARWAPDAQSVVPNLAESIDIAPDGTAYTFMLREGIRWSDGAPFSADDIMFWFDDVASIPELSGGLGPNSPTVEKIDQYTVRFTFAEPYGLFLQQTVAATAGDAYTRYPKHYLQQFHKTYADPASLDQLVSEAGAADWVELFRTKGGAIPGTPYDARWQNPDLPTLFAWRITSPYGAGTRVVAERNPYYWKVDSAGNQLPYLDEVIYDNVEDTEVLLLKAANGEIDMQDRHVGEQLSNKPVLADAMESGNFHFFDVQYSRMNAMIIALNLNHKNPTLRQVFQNKDFRIGLSHAINRQEIIDTIYVGQGEPWQAAPQRETPFFNEQLATQYTAYDVAIANEYLDKAFPDKDGDGFRLGPDGNRIVFQVEAATNVPDKVDAMGLVARHWSEVGIECQVKPEDRSLFTTRKESNDHDGTVWWGTGGLEGMITPVWYLPYDTNSDFAQAWQSWHTNPSGEGALTQPEEPPEVVRQQIALYEQLKTTPDEQEQIDLFKQVLQIAADQFYVMGICSSPPGFGVVKNNFHNVPASMISGGLYSNPSHTNPSQYYLAQEQD